MKELNESINNILDYIILICCTFLGLSSVITGLISVDKMIIALGYWQLSFSIAYGFLMKSWESNKELKTTIELLERVE